MKILYYDCFAGISGDMNLGAMLDLGVSQKELESELRKLKLGEWKLKVSKDERGGIFGTRVDVLCKDNTHLSALGKSAKNAKCHSYKPHCNNHHSHHQHRTWRDIKKIISASKLNANVKKISLNIFEKIAEAEAKVHGKKIDDVHFHEVGALDSIIDIVGAAVCIDILKPDKICSSSVELGGGTVKCAHSVMPVPAPATAEIVRAAKNFSVKMNGAPHECTTPTGAAIVAALAENFLPEIGGKFLASGVGIGHRVCEELPNFLRLNLIEVSKDFFAGEKNFSALNDKAQKQSFFLRESMREICANIDDDTPEMLSLLCEALFEAGALDVWQESIFAKKGRLGVKVCALVSKNFENEVAEAYLKNSTTTGIRIYALDRLSIPRKVETKKTRHGNLGVKISDCKELGRKYSKLEFDDFKKVLKKHAKAASEANLKKRKKEIKKSENFRKIYEEARFDACAASPKEKK